MSTLAFSEWPGAWERHIIRQAKNPGFFYPKKPPVQQDLLEAQQRDQQELTQFNQHLAQLAIDCANLADDSTAKQIAAIKNDLDRRYDTACGLGADLAEQKQALVMLNDVITNAVTRAHRNDDEHGRLLLIKQESLRMRHLTRLNYPIVCDLLRAVPPVPAAEVPAALLSESDEAFTVALEVLGDSSKRYLAHRIKLIKDRLHNDRLMFRVDRKHNILKKQLALTNPIEEVALD